jgi:hypothetical protein
MDFIPCVSITPDYLITYETFEGSKKHNYNPEGLKKRQHDGSLSPSAIKRLRLALDWLFYLTFEKTKINYKKRTKKQFRLTFVTLTLPSKQVHSDQEIKSQCLNQFLIEARKKWFIEHYVWRAEKQQNGNIHFHIITDKYIPHAELRKFWNRIINKLQFVTEFQKTKILKYKNGISKRDFKNDPEFRIALNRYRKGKAQNWSSPNSTDIHGIETVKNLKAYVSKYMSKKEKSGTALETQKIAGRIWFISLALSKVKKAKTELYSTLISELNKLMNIIPEKITTTEYCRFFKIKAAELLTYGCTELFSVFANYFLKWQKTLYG